MDMTFKSWLLKEDTVTEDQNKEKIEGSLNKLIEVMKGKKDAESKNILKMAKGILKKLKKDGGISSESAQWLFKTWTSFRA